MTPTAKFFILLLNLVLVCLISRAQSDNNVVSVGDSILFVQLIDQSKALRNSDADSALRLAVAALDMAQALHSPRRITVAHNQLGILYRYRGDLDSAHEQYESSLGIYQRLDDSLGMAKTWHNLGIIARKRGELTQALEYELKSLPQFEKEQDSIALGHSLNSLGNTYALQENWPRAISYYQKGLVIQEKLGNEAGAARSLYNMGIIYYQQSRLEQADSVFSRGLLVSEKLDDKRAVAKTYHSLGVIQKDLGNLIKAKEHLQNAQRLQREMEDTEGELFTLLGLAELEEVNKQWPQAEATFREALTLAVETGLIDEELTAHEHLANILEKQGRIPEAMAQLKLATSLKDSLREESTSMRILELQEKYETDKKEKENKLLVQENQLKENELEAKSQSLLFRNVVLGVLAVILVLSGLLLLSYRQRLRTNRQLAAQREELNRQKMLDLMREQELAFVNATLIGQETERNRIAADLHDGLSNMLVTVKLHFENLADQFQDQEEAVLTRYRQAVDLLNDLCKKARSLAHEIADEQSQFHLEPALKELVGIIEQTGQLKTELSIHGLDQPVSATIENAVFHTLRELIGNCLKHAEATTLSIQLTRSAKELNILVEDNGKGFDPDESIKSDGMGLASVNERIQKLNGIVQIDAAINRGTVINIDIPLEPNTS